ncbi:MAG: hypothetical protein JNK23_10665 [Opitutaceae bacterium]|nr:hypothetical protein [Opitutaceae bacterium]
MDLNLLSFAHHRPLGYHAVGDLTPSAEIADTLKVTDCAGGRIVAGHIIGGREDCIDVNNHCEGIVIEAAVLEPRGKYIATIKGGSRHITLRCPCVIGHGTETDIDLGNISDQSDEVTGPTLLDCQHQLGPLEPIRVRVLGATRPILLNPIQRYEITVVVPGFFRSWFLKAAKQLKKIFR